MAKKIPAAMTTYNRQASIVSELKNKHGIAISSYGDSASNMIDTADIDIVYKQCLSTLKFLRNACTLYRYTISVGSLVHERLVFGKARFVESKSPWGYRRYLTLSASDRDEKDKASVAKTVKVLDAQIRDASYSYSKYINDFAAGSSYVLDLTLPCMSDGEMETLRQTFASGERASETVSIDSIEINATTMLHCDICKAWLHRDTNMSMHRWSSHCYVSKLGSDMKASIHNNVSPNSEISALVYSGKIAGKIIPYNTECYVDERIIELYTIYTNTFKKSESISFEEFVLGAINKDGGDAINEDSADSCNNSPTDLEGRGETSN